MEPVELRIREDESGESRFLTRVDYDGVSNLEGFRVFLEGLKIIPWPFDFWDSKARSRIARQCEHVNTLKLHGYVVIVIRSHGGLAMAEKKLVAWKEPMAGKKRMAEHHSLQDDGCKREVMETMTTTNEPMAEQEPMAVTEPTVFGESRNDQEETRCLKLEPKHKIFLSHSGAQKRFVQHLCKELETYNLFAFFDQSSDSLPKGEKFSPLIIEAARRCHVAVVVLSEEYLSSKWPMLELAHFVDARKSDNKRLKLFPLFYEASVDDLSNEAIENKWMPKWMELAKTDTRIKPEEWGAAVRELRGVNGRVFGKNGIQSEVGYIDVIVKDIFERTPPDFLYDTSKIFGHKRICEILRDKFLPHTRTSAKVLGLYGMGGLGKTTMSQSLCNLLNEEFIGRVCYIEIKEGVQQLERQQMVMKKLLRLSGSLLQSVCDVSQGWNLLRTRMKEHPVFLVIDNIQSSGESKEEACEYFDIEYHERSKIMVISRGLDVVEDLLGESRYCCEIPCLTKEEAAEVFLQQAAPWLNKPLTWDESGVVEKCVSEAWFSDGSPGQNGVGHFHPLALKAVGAYFHGKSKTFDRLSWSKLLEKYKMIKGTVESDVRMFKILGAQFSILDISTQLMFVDICLYASKAFSSPMLSNSPLEDLIGWLANLHGERTEVVRMKIFNFKKIAMIDIKALSSSLNPGTILKVIVHDLYMEYAIWFLEQVNREKGVLGVWCVDKHRDVGRILPDELHGRPPGGFWYHLKRIRLEYIECDDFPAGKVQEWCNVVVLQIENCDKLTTLNLKGLSCLRHLELKNLRKLKTLTFTGYGNNSTGSLSHEISTEPSQYFPPLLFVIIDELPSLECLPSFSPFSSLKFLKVVGCEGLTQPPSVQHCSGLERLSLSWHPKQKSLPSVDGLTSLRDLTIRRSRHESYRGRALQLEGLSSLISLGALELRYIPVGSLSGLEKLRSVEYIYLSGMQHLTCLLPLGDLAISSLHVLEVTTDYVDANMRLEGLVQLKSLIKAKLDVLAAGGELVPHTPSKISEPLQQPDWEPRCYYAERNIFLSHSGFQKGFTENLCERLEAVCRFPFFDKRDDSLRKGEKFFSPLMKAARKCRVAVVVLSEEFFTKSKWPMMELNEFVKEQESGYSRLRILPLYFKITREEIKKKCDSKSWKAAWNRFKETDDSIDIGEWKHAVSKIQGINGIEYRGKDEGVVEFIKRVVEHLCKLVPPDLQWDVSEVQSKDDLCQPILKRLKEVEAVDKENGKVGVVGLYGMGGVGKTTISKAICNEIYGDFDGKVCHVEFGSAKDRVELLKNVLRVLTEASPDILVTADHSQLVKLLKERMRRQKVFLVLDNVWDHHVEEVERYLKAGYHEGSMVLVTSRSLAVLVERLGISRRDCMEMPDLEEEGATNLFLQHTGRSRESIKTDDEWEIVGNCVNECRFVKQGIADSWNGVGGSYHYHPLALKVLGAALKVKGRRSGNMSGEVVEWKEILEKLKCDKFNMLGKRASSFSLFFDWDMMHFKNSTNTYSWTWYLCGCAVGGMASSGNGWPLFMRKRKLRCGKL